MKRLKNFFIPSESNSHKPHSLRTKTTLSILGSIVAVQLLALLMLLRLVPAQGNFLAAVLPDVLVMASNKERVEKDIDPLASNALLAEAARMKAEDMAKNGYFAHTSPDGKEPWYWIGQAGYQYSAAGENLAVNFTDSRAVVRAWMKSPLHRDNILESRFSEIGVGTATGTYKGKEAVFVVQYFGTPAVSNNTSVIVQNIPSSSNNIQGAQIMSYDLPTFMKMLASSPQLLAGIFLTIVAIYVISAVLLKVFVKAKIQYPKLILNGLLVLMLAAGCLAFNAVFSQLTGTIAIR